MNDNNNDKNIYNASEIQRYLNGRMSALEMHALEHAALEDPLLADAIEGYDQDKLYKETDIATDLKDLHNRLTSRVESKNQGKVIPLFKRSWWKIAAMILVIAGSGSVIYYLTYFNSPSNKSVIATYKSPEQKITKTDTILTENVNTFDSTSLAVTDMPLKTASPKTIRRPELITSSAAPGMVTQAPSPVTSSAPVRSQSDSVAAADSFEDRAVASMSESKIMQNRQSTASFDEVSRKKAGVVLKRSTDRLNAAPVMGLTAFNHYLENNKKIPPDSINIPGEVIVSFIVKEDGELSDFKIEKSLSRQADNEAIRLIKEGPAWKVLRDQRAKATISIKF